MSNSAWAKEAVGTSAIFSSKELRPFCAWAAPRPWANGAGNSSPEKATAMSPSLPLPARAWSKSGTCSRATRPPRWKPTKASLSNSTSSPWHWARLGVASSSLVTPCPLASTRFEAEPFNPSILRHENEPTKTNHFDGGCAPPNPAPLAAAGARGELPVWLACGKRRKNNTPKLFSCMTTCPSIWVVKIDRFIRRDPDGSQHYLSALLVTSIQRIGRVATDA